MSQTGLLKLALGGALVAALAAAGPTALAQNDLKPVNDLPNPYRTIADHFKMPEGRAWGSTSAVAIAPDGTSVWIAERCGANSCLNSPDVDPIMHFDANGTLLKSFGKGMLIFPHGIWVDRDGNVWITDGQDNAPRPQRGAPMPAGPHGDSAARRDRRATRSSSSARTARCS